MFKKILPYELARILLLAGEAACVVAVAYGAVRTVWFISQWILSPFSLELMLQAAGALPKKVAFVGKIVEFFATDLTAQEAKEAVTKYATYVIIGVAVLIVLRWLLKLLERGFRQKFMPYVLKEDFSDFTYESKKRKAAEETLCDVGLLGRAERYYTANRLQGLYRDCWVAAEEIVCGGVYGENYTSHKVKARGQWLTVRLNCDFEGTVILESRDTKNDFSLRGLAKRMVEIQFSYTAFGQRFRCFTDSTEDAYALLTRQMADKLMRLQEKYPDLCVIFYEGCIHVLIRRRSFDRRWEMAIPFCIPHLRQEKTRLYGAVEDFTDLLLE